MTGRDADAAVEADAVAWLRSARAVRERCGHVWAAAEAGELADLRIDPSAWPGVVDAVAAQVLATHPTGPIPVHGRLNHLRSDAGGWDLAADLLAAGARGEADVVGAVVVSVLLDAGAGPAWGIEDPVAGPLRRSEGLAVAAHRAIESGALAGDGSPWRVDAAGLAAVTPSALAAMFHVTPSNPLEGLEGRAGLLGALGRVLAAAGADTVGALLRRDLLGGAEGGGGSAGAERLPAADLLGWLLDRFADLWPGRATLGGRGLGDTWPHPAAGGTGPSAGLVPFHKLTQWLAWSLVEPLAHAGVRVVDLDEGLTGLAEYRNGGLLVELGLVTLPGGIPTAPLPAGHPTVVGWRALTVVALDRIARELDDHLPSGRRGLSLGELLEAGTWPLGRRLARARTPAATPPIPVLSDGTVF